MPIPENLKNRIFDIIFIIHDENDILLAYANIQNHTLSVNISNEDKEHLKDSFILRKNINNDFPGFLFIKIDLNTQLIIVDYHPESIFENELN